MSLSLFLIATTLFSLVGADEADVKFIRDYFRARTVSQIVAFGCWDSYGKMEVFRSLAGLDTRLSLMPISVGQDMRELMKVNYYRIGVFLDLDCEQSNFVTDQFISARLPFNESYFWLMKTIGSRAPLEMLDLLPLSINAELTLATTATGGAHRYELYDVYNPSYRHGGKLNFTRMGYWDRDEGLRIHMTQYKYKRRGDLRGMVLNFSIVVDFPPANVDMATYLTTPIQKHLDTMHRYNYALTLQLRDYYNFTMNLMRGGTWGYLINGTFNGIVGDMIKGIVDVGATPFQFKPERMDVMDYTVQAYMARAAVIFRHPKRQTLNNSFLEPFSKQVWWLTAVVGLINWILLYLTIKMEQRYVGNVQGSTLFTQPESETFLITSAAICQQGLSDTPRVYSGRIVYMSLFLWALLLYQFYSASIVGSLLSEKPRFIRSIKDLAESSLEVGIEDMPYNHDFFRTTSDKNVIELFERKIALNKRRKKFPYYKAEEGLRRVQRGDFAFQVDVATAYKIITDTFSENEICDLQEIELFGPKHTATCTAKHSPFKKMITYGLRQIVEHGMAQRLGTVWKQKRPLCPESHSSTPTPVSLDEFSPALVMIAAAFSISIFIMLAENLVRRSLRRRRLLTPLFRRASAEKIDSRDETKVSQET
ncbi:ionotropic receptor 75a-like isoform X1 [Nasonia vitripennis]|uniref:Uncharacterized protein n=1 Tax=Nasonia vitripennis TaxID=7425 RepID=A0A7M7M2H4_NASVI|nr:ionotropic receptor 75a-like isoform X1 [Nasonia vitripennis]